MSLCPVLADWHNGLCEPKPSSGLMEPSGYSSPPIAAEAFRTIGAGCGAM
jgi:hypothetical protein